MKSVVYINPIENDSNLYYCVYKNKNRIIYNPCGDLRKYQKMILYYIKKNFNLSLNTRKAAIVHCKRKWIFKTDIKSFYESFSKEQLERTIRNLCAELRETCTISEKVMYDVCTLNGKLPTGALTSAHIANYAFKIMKIDEIIIEYCRQNEVNYSRYMDDLTFSADDKQKLKDTEDFVKKLLSLNGFSLNSEKTKYISNNKKQEVLGLLVNNKVATISKMKKNQFRALIFNYLKSVNIEERLGTDILFNRKITLANITGYMAYLKSSDERYYNKMKEYLAAKINKFDLYNNKEIQRLISMLKLKELQLKLI